MRMCVCSNLLLVLRYGLGLFRSSSRYWHLHIRHCRQKPLRLRRSISRRKYIRGRRDSASSKPMPMVVDCVKGKVSLDNKNFTDADLERRFQQQEPPCREAIIAITVLLLLLLLLLCYYYCYYKYHYYDYHYYDYYNYYYCYYYYYYYYYYC